MGFPCDANVSSRLHERRETRFGASVRVHPDHADQFRLSFPDALSDFIVTDVSKGGIGLRSSIYFPRNLRLTLSVRECSEHDNADSPSLTIRVIVRRCVMTDHNPTYSVGLQFVDPSGTDEARLVRAAGFQAEEPSPVTRGAATAGRGA